MQYVTSNDFNCSLIMPHHTENKLQESTDVWGVRQSQNLINILACLWVVSDPTPGPTLGCVFVHAHYVTLYMDALPYLQYPTANDFYCSWASLLVQDMNIQGDCPKPLKNQVH